METKFVLIPVNELKLHLMEAIEEAETKKRLLQIEAKQKETLFTINEVAKRLGRAHSTIKKLISQGILRTTADGRISEKAINDYLTNT